MFGSLISAIMYYRITYKNVTFNIIANVRPVLAITTAHRDAAYILRAFVTSWKNLHKANDIAHGDDS